ncbi:hypothetical protein NDU88_005819 [Pleurodeles waltl]|uniref:Uncharacterized protein n=1 Tax=Pleurodeles waltl TaxID=8319 RepID=A0AAV7VN06_PLEWA|nr:hypothetical protein NDU88_005819 [Pleurodeles waltl]
MTYPSWGPKRLRHPGKGDLKEQSRRAKWRPHGGSGRSRSNKVTFRSAALEYRVCRGRGGGGEDQTPQRGKTSAASAHRDRVSCATAGAESRRDLGSAAVSTETDAPHHTGEKPIPAELAHALAGDPGAVP